MKIVFYGIFSDLTQFHNDPDIEHLGPVTFKGTLISIDDCFPAFIQEGNNTIHGHLYDVPEEIITYYFDSVERFYPENLVVSMYVRKIIKVVQPDGKTGFAQAYVWNRPTSYFKPIESGKWLEYILPKRFQQTGY